MKKYKPCKKEKKLKKTNYAMFNLNDIFIVTGTKTTKKDVLETYGDGVWPYITTRSTNNGVDGYYNYYTEEGNVITIDSATIGFASYQEKEFSASDHVEKLIPKFKLNSSIAMYIITILNQELLGMIMVENLIKVELKKLNYCYHQLMAQITLNR